MLQVNKLEWVWRFHQIWIASCGFTPCRRWLGSQPTVSWRLWEGLQTNASNSSPDWCANFGLTKFWGPKTSATLFRLLHISATISKGVFFLGFWIWGDHEMFSKNFGKGGFTIQDWEPFEWNSTFGIDVSESMFGLIQPLWASILFQRNTLHVSPRTDRTAPSQSSMKPLQKPALFNPV